MTAAAIGCVKSYFAVRELARPLLLYRSAMIGAASIPQESGKDLQASGLGCRSQATASRRGIMLVLTRKRSEMIQIGDNVVIKVLQTGRGSVKIGILAPDDVRVIRAELAGAPAPGHPLAAFLEERREIKRGKAHRRFDPQPEGLIAE
jgi:carbon storage regulator